MKIAFTHNLRLTDSEEEAEFDTAETVEAIAKALAEAGHEVDKIEVSSSASSLVSRLEASDPDLIFNTAEGRRGKAREAFYPALFEELGYPYTGSDAHALTLTLDKWMTKLVLAEHGISSPRGKLVTRRSQAENGLGLAFPVIVKPNYEGSSKGIGEETVAWDAASLAQILRKELEEYPAGVLVEEFVAGDDVTVGFIEGLGPEKAVLWPVDYLFDPAVTSEGKIIGYRLKNVERGFVQPRCPADIPRDVAARLRTMSRSIFNALNLRDTGRIDYRLCEDGRIFLLEVNALPSLEKGSALFAAAAHAGVSFDNAIAAIVNGAALRWKLATPEELGAPKRRRSQQVRVGFTYNMKRVDTKDGDDAEAEYDPPETIAAIADSIASFGHAVVHLEATQDLPRILAEADVDLVFNIAEGLSGRNREAQVPALCELLGIPYTGSDSATLSICLDKSLTKKVLKQHGIMTPEFQLFETGRERLQPDLKFPVIVKPNAEGSSKGIARNSVFDNEEGMREAVKTLIEKYRQPALVEEYIAGREFTIGLLGDRRPRVLPPMEIVFKDKSESRPVYDFTVKQEWEKHVEYRCPAPLSSSELKALERTARKTFQALDCRDVARIDVRMDEKGTVYVLEVNPLPGLTPGYSDLVLISKPTGIEYRELIGEILAGALKRMREKRRIEREEARAQEEAERKAAEGDKPATPAGGAAPASGNGSGNGKNRADTNGGAKASGSESGNGSGSKNGKNSRNGKTPAVDDSPAAPSGS